MNLETGEITQNSSAFYGSGERLNTSVNAIYGARDGTSPNDVVEYDISTGPITRQFDSPYHGDYCVFGPVWFSPDGRRVYTGCGTIFNASRDPDLDMRYLSSLQDVTAVGAFAESAAIQRIALIRGRANQRESRVDDGKVMLFESTYLKPVGQFTLPAFNVGGGTASRPTENGCSLTLNQLS